MRINNWRDCIRNRHKWKEFVRRPKLVTFEAVAPHEEDEEDTIMIRNKTAAASNQ
jgi:hypothetical protein